jgi:hypothetical protein
MIGRVSAPPDRSVDQVIRHLQHGGGKATPEAAMEAAQEQADALMQSYVEQTALKLPE